MPTEISYTEEEFILPKFQLFVQPSLQFYLLVYGWMIGEGHEIYTNHNHSIQYTSLSLLLKEIESFKLCAGVQLPESDTSILLKKHTIPKTFAFTSYEPGQLRSCELEFIRATDCDLQISK